MDFFIRRGRLGPVLVGRCMDKTYHGRAWGRNAHRALGRVETWGPGAVDASGRKAVVARATFMESGLERRPRVPAQDRVRARVAPRVADARVAAVAALEGHAAVAE